MPIFNNPAFSEERTLYWEHEGSRAIRKGDLKMVAEINQPWELYDMKSDRSETINLAKNQSATIKELEKLYLQWCQKVGVIDWDTIK